MRNAVLFKKSAVGFDNIGAHVLVHIAEYIVTPLRHIVNHFFLSRNISRPITIAMVAPIFMLGDVRDFENYRPVSLLCRL